MKIAIIDCKLSKDVLCESLHINNNIMIKSQIPQEENRQLAHSSFVLNILEKYTTKPNLYILYEIMSPKFPGKASYVMNALLDIIDNDIPIVILSLVVYNNMLLTEFHKLCKRAKENNTLIFAAGNNEIESNSIPAIFPEVFGVGRGTFFEYPYYSYIGGNIQISGDCTPEFTKCSDGTYRLFGGTSKAVPKLIGVIQNAYSEGVNKFIDMENYLKEKQIANANEKEHTLANSTLIKKSILEKITEIVNDFRNDTVLKYSDIKTNNKSTFELLLNHKDIDKFLLQVFYAFNINVHLTDLNYYDFYTIYHLSQFIQNAQRGENT